MFNILVLLTCQQPIIMSCATLVAPHIFTSNILGIFLMLLGPSNSGDVSIRIGQATPIPAALKHHKHHTSYVLLLHGDSVSWKSRRLDSVPLSPSEAEFVADSQCGQEVRYLRVILLDFHPPQNGATIVNYSIIK